MPRTLFVETSLVTIEVELGGTDGSLVVLLPGAGGGLRRFGALAEALVAGGFRTAAINPRGAGLSRGALEGLTLHDHAADAAAVIRRLDGAPATVVGVGFGNRQARCLATDHPTLVSRLVLLGAGGRVPAEPEAAEAMRVAFDEARPLADREAAARTAFFAPGSTATPDLSTGSAWAARAQSEALARTSLEEWWAGGDAPILALQGVHDRLAPPTNGHLLREAFPHRVTCIDVLGAAHALMVEQPAEVARHVLAFLRG